MFQRVFWICGLPSDCHVNNLWRTQFPRIFLTLNSTWRNFEFKIDSPSLPQHSVPPILRQLLGLACGVCNPDRCSMFSHLLGMIYFYSNDNRGISRASDCCLDWQRKIVPIAMLKLLSSWTGGKDISSNHTCIRILYYKHNHTSWPIRLQGSKFFVLSVLRIYYYFLVYSLC